MYRIVVIILAIVSLTNGTFRLPEPLVDVGVIHKPSFLKKARDEVPSW